MSYPQLTIFNYKILYFVLRIFGLYWLFIQFTKFLDYTNRPSILYEPVFKLQKLIFPEFPSLLVFTILVSFCGVLLITTLFKQSYFLNILIFLLATIINLPINANYGVHHDAHIIILSFFLSIFLLPKELKDDDYKLVQYFYLGLLVTYSLAGLSKILGTIKNLIKQTDKVLWIDKNAAKYNTFDNYYRADVIVPFWIKNLYNYENFWVFITIIGILAQFLCFLGAFNRKLLTFFMIFLFVFHLYTMKFVLAEFEGTNIFILVAFFPYHIFRQYLNKNLNLNL